MSRSYYDARLYLQDTNLTTISSNEQPDLIVVKCEKLEVVGGKFGPSTHKVVLNKTIFHPQGGGQPSDVGVIELQTTTSKRSRFQVVIALNSPDSTIEHFGYNLPNESEDDVQFTDLTSGDLSPFTITLTVDADKRRRHSHLHSVGHMIDGAMKTIGYDSTKFKPAKGYHFNDGPYVEYEIIDANLMKEISTNKESDKFFDEIVQHLQQHLELMVSQKIDTIVSYTPGNEENGSEQLIRVVNVAGCECPCGGTHIGNTQEITERIVVTKIKRKKSTLKVSYDLETV